MAAYGSRRHGIQEPRRKVVLVCEGKATEINYFNGFKTRQSPVQIIPVHGKCTDPINIVDFAKRQLRDEDLNIKEGDGLWCVFDVDSNPEDSLSKAKDIADKHNIRIALSNPCIELWFILHFQDFCSYIERDEAKRKMKCHIPRYEESLNINEPPRSKLRGIW